MEKYMLAFFACVWRSALYHLLSTFATLLTNRQVDIFVDVRSMSL
jgi:hypothetical protein